LKFGIFIKLWILSKVVLTLEPNAAGMSKLIPRTETSRDRLQLVIFGIAAIAALTFLGSVVAVLLMHAL